MTPLTRRISALALGILATPLGAAEHEIIILGSSFFPTVTYVQPGDSLRFINESDAAQAVIAANSAWTTGSLASAEEMVLQVSTQSEGLFHGDTERTITGEISFGTPPLND
jgi:plastocyanin